MYRKALTDLNHWKNSDGRKPMIIRGARQVGKTWLVREFAGKHFEHYIEINFDKSPKTLQLFKSGDISRCLQLLEVETGIDIIPGKHSFFSTKSKPERKYFRC